MKKLLRGAQAVKQKAGVVQGTTDEGYDELEREINKLQKAAKELPKVVHALAEGLKGMWKCYSKMTAEMNKVTSVLDLSPLASEMSRKMGAIGTDYETVNLDKLNMDLNGSAVEVLRKLEQDIKSLEHIREERSKRRLEFDAAREKITKKEAELTKKGKDIESDPTIRARRIDVETAGKAYEVSNARSMEEMSKVTSVKDDVFKMTSYNISVFLGEYLRQAGESLLNVKQMYESALNGGAVYCKEAVAPVEPVPVPTPAPEPTPVQEPVKPPSPTSSGSGGEKSPTAATGGGFASPSSPAQGSAAAEEPASPSVQSPIALGNLPPPLDGRRSSSAGQPAAETPASPSTPKGVMAYAEAIQVAKSPPPQSMMEEHVEHADPNAEGGAVEGAAGQGGADEN